MEELKPYIGEIVFFLVMVLTMAVVGLWILTDFFEQLFKSAIEAWNRRKE